MKQPLKKIMLTLMASTALLQSVGSASAQMTHVVQPGEWLLAIARAYGVSLEDLKAWNGLSGDWIDVGQVLYVENPGTGSPAPSAPSTTTPSGAYVVQPGDTLFNLAYARGMSVETLMAYNGLTSTWLNVGDILYFTNVANSDPITTVPSGPANPNYTGTNGVYIVQPGDTLSYIAAANGVSVETLMAWNGLSSTWLNVGDRILVTGTNEGSYTPPSYSDSGDWATYYTVQPGDTLWDIANAFGTSYEALMAYNNLASSYLNVGDQLLVPGSGAPTVPSAPVETPVSSNTSSQTNGNASNASEDSEKEASSKETTTKEGAKTLTKEELMTATKEELEEYYKTLPEKARPKKHKIVEGDTLEGIAKQYNFSQNSLREWNALAEGDLPAIGEEIYVSNPRFIPETYKVQAGDSLESIAQAKGVTADDLDKWNQLEGKAAATDTVLVIEDPTPRQHTVKPGESLDAIAEKYAVTKEQLVEWNNLPQTVQFFNGTLAVVDPEGVTFEKDMQQNANQETTTTSEN